MEEPTPAPAGQTDLERVREKYRHLSEPSRPTRSALQHDGGFRDDPTPSPPMTEDDHARDNASRSMGFRTWLWRRVKPTDRGGGGDPDARRIWDRAQLKGPPSVYSFEAWAACLDDEQDLELLARLEAEWRLERRASEQAQHALEIDPVRRSTFRDPTLGSVIKCRYVDPTSTTRCGAAVVPGTARCRRHGGELVDAQTRRAVLISAYLQIVDASSEAVDTLVTVARDGRNELARVQAAKEILDRAGLTAELQVNVRVETAEREEHLQRLTDRLGQMRTGLQARVQERLDRPPLADPPTETTGRESEGQP